MQKIEHKINLNLSQPNNFEYIHAMQGDYDSDIVTATLYDKNTLYTIDANKAILQGTTESNSLIVYDKVTINADKHSITFPLTKEMLSEYGDISFILSLVDTNNNQKKSAFPFIVKNTKDATSSTSVSVLQAITDYVKRAEDAANKAEQNNNTSLENKNLAEKAANTATQKANEALTSANKAKTSETNSKNSEVNASASASSAKSSANTATSQATSASTSATNSANSAKLSQSWAVGGTKSRDDEDTNNSKYYSTQSSNYASNAKASETASKTSEVNASKSETNAKTSADSASLSATNASTSETNAQSSATASSKSAQASATSEANAKQSATNAKASETSASKYASNASISATTASEKADVASSKATSATASEKNALSYANSAKEYRDTCVSIAQGLEGALMPMGTIKFSQLPTDAQAGYMYNISDDFTSDDRFKDGASKTYPAGTNVYWTSDGKWDVLAGSLEKYAFKTDFENHVGNKNNPHAVTKSQVGLGNVPNVATNDQTVTYTDSSTLTTLSSGEKMSVAFGKIKKAISDLISHIADTTKHITSSERTLWNTVSGKVDKVDGKGLSTNDYTTTEKNKLNGIESGANKITIDSALSSTSANPVQNKVVNTALSGKANSSHNHDDRYYTEAEMNTKLAGKSDTGHKHTKSEITDFPSSMPASDVSSWAKAATKPSYAWSEITGKPTTFTPATHTHNYAGSSSAGGAANSANIVNKTTGFLDGASGRFTYYDACITNTANNANWSAPSSEWYQIYHNDLSVQSYWTELAFPVNDTNGLAWRQRRNGNYYGWYRLLDSNNFANYAATKSHTHSYNDLTNKPSIPSVGNGTVTITQNGTSKGSFTMNQSGNTTIALTDNNTTYSVATTSANGLMSKDMVTKLNGIASGATAVSDSTVSGWGYKKTDTNTWRPVVNNLTSTATDQSLSAAQGKALDDKITSINNNLTKLNVQQSGGNLNGLVGSTAKYFIINGTNTPSGSERHGFLVCLYYSGLYFAPFGNGAVPITKQIYMPFWGAERLFTRTYRHDTSEWTSWKEF